MKSVLLIGFDPLTVDFSDPALPPGMTAEKIHAGVKLALADFAGRGWHPDVCFINPDETAFQTVEHCLAGDVYDCVVIGAGVRLPPSRLVLFEAWSTPSIAPRPKPRSPSILALTIAVRQPRAGSDTRSRAAFLGTGETGDPCSRPDSLLLGLPLQPTRRLN